MAMGVRRDLCSTETSGGVCKEMGVRRSTLWEPGLPAKTEASSTPPWQTHRFREQARLLQKRAQPLATQNQIPVLTPLSNKNPLSGLTVDIAQT
jgi:hypothetical protein